ncbi:MlaD family protein [Brytella acorum]|uniref:MlaD family protein n=1 Tax=Brytella acorum TaxID=2959299 RepID=A0AA35UPD1_9PROT|nr:MlaD family protein [Brytella acorum]MDF3624473.1 MlaD family protein [Brytella acorum]CAI9119677.1 MlaD family protein [Brytella acorum]
MAAGKRGGAILASALVLGVACGFSIYADAQKHGRIAGGTELHARFNSANGLHAGAKVLLAGVEVGRVRDITLDPATQLADVAFVVDSRLHLPKDSVLGIVAPTMTSDNALEITPGKAVESLAAGAVISDTRDQLSLEQQVSNYIFGGALGGG